MKTLSAALKAHYAQGTTTLATCWKATLADGTVIAATSHDTDIVFDGVTYVAAQGFMASNIESTSELNPDNLELQGVLGPPAISDEDLHTGAWDYADLIVFEVNYNDLSAGRNVLRVGRLGQVSSGRAKFNAEFRGLLQAYSRTIGRLVTEQCPYDLGDSRCTVDLIPLTVDGVVDSTAANRIIYDATRTEDANWFAGAKVTFTSGLNIGRSMEVTQSAAGSITLAHPLFDLIAPGDTYSVYGGCSKRFLEDCVNKHANGINFGGFPDLPQQKIYRIGGISSGSTTGTGGSTGDGTGGGGTAAP